MSAHRGGDDWRRYSSANYYGYDGADDTSPSSSTGGGTVRVGHSRAGSSAGGGGAVARDPERSYRDRVNQIVQAFYWKAVMVVVQSRMPVTPTLSKTGERKLNKWFNIELDEMDMFKEELAPWKTCDAFDPRPPPVVIETYIDTSDLTPTQALVILDSKGKRWNVSETLEDAANRTGYGMGPRRGVDKAQHQIVLERWRIELCPPYDTTHRQELPVVYKKCIILFRALYSYVSLMPTWKFRRRLNKPKLQPSALKVLCRIVSPDDIDSQGRRPGLDTLKLPLCNDPVTPVEKYEFGKVETPAGYFSISVQYRENCDFRIDDSEALLSSQFINYDEHHHHREVHVRPSPTPSSFARIHQRTSSQPTNYRDQLNGTPSSLPGPQPYGSLSTYHQANPASASPISALRAAAEYADRVASGTASSSSSSAAAAALHTMGSRTSLRSEAGAHASRRGSLTFMQPFKSPSLSSSPAIADGAYRPPMLDRGATAVPSRPHRLSIGTNTTPSPGSNKSLPTATGSGVVSSPVDPNQPRPQSMTRITSSFGSRRPRTGTSGANYDDANSSGQASYASIPGTSSYEEDLQIRDFMTLISEGQKRPVSFASTNPTTTTSTSSFSSSPNSFERRFQQRTTSPAIANPLLKFQKIQESQMQLAESLSSSLMIMSSSQRLGNPHSPAVPSRLSEGLSANNPNNSSGGGSPSATPATVGSVGKRSSSSSSNSPRLGPARPISVSKRSTPIIGAPPASSSSTTTSATTSAVPATSPRDIPVSPKPRATRSNSMSLHPPHAIDAELPSTSYDSAKNMSAVRLPLELSGSVSGGGIGAGGPGGSSIADTASGAGGDVVPSSIDSSEAGAAATAASTSSNPTTTTGLGLNNPITGTTAASAARSAATDTNRRSLNSHRRGSGRPGMGIPSWSRTGLEDEDLVFAMSDVVTTSGSGGVGSGRRSMENQQGSLGRGGAAGMGHHHHHHHH